MKSAGTYKEGRDLLKSQTWDVVLTDLHFISSKKKVLTANKDFNEYIESLLESNPEWRINEKDEGEPLGAILALRAIALGVKYVGLVTDADHHRSTASAGLDGFPQFNTSNSHVLCTNKEITSMDAETLEIVSGNYHPRREYRRVKDWAKVLGLLTGEISPPPCID